MRKRTLQVLQKAFTWVFVTGYMFSLSSPAFANPPQSNNKPSIVFANDVESPAVSPDTINIVVTDSNNNAQTNSFRYIFVSNSNECTINNHQFHENNLHNLAQYQSGVDFSITVSNQNVGKYICAFASDDISSNQNNDHDTVAVSSHSFSYPIVDTQAPSGAIVINSDDTYTNSIAVNLELSATDNTGVTEMEISNDSLFTGAVWEAYGTSKSWNINNSDGTQEVFVQYKDAAGNISATESDSIILDTNVDSVVSNSLTTDDITPQLSATVVDSLSGVDKVVFVVEGISYDSTSHTGDTWYLDISSSLDDGTYHFYTIGYDKVGNDKTSDEATLIVNTDKTGPILNVTNPMNGAVLQSINTVSGTVSDDKSGVKSVAMHIYRVLTNGSKELITGCTTIPAEITGGNWIADITNNGKCVLGEGTFEIRAFAYDKAGNPGWAPASTFTIDTTAPEAPANLSFSSTTGTVLGCGTYTNQYTVIATWDASSSNDVAYYEYRSYNPTTGWVYGPVNMGTSLSRTGSFTVGNGTYGFAVRAIDYAGNPSEWTSENIGSSCQITYDNVPPSQPVITNTPNNSYTNVNAITINWTGGDDQGNSPFGIKGYIISYTFSPASGGNDINWTSNLIASGNPGAHFGTYGHGEGKYVISVRTVDYAGNVSPVSDSFTITYDNTAPTTPTNLHFQDNEGNIVECGEYSNTLHIGEYWDASYDVNFDHYEYSSYNAPNGSTGLVSKILTTNYFDSYWWTIPKEGAYGFQVRAVDKAGNVSDWALVNAYGIANSCQINIDWTSPTVDIIFSGTGSTVKGFDVVFSEDVSSTEATDPANYFLDNWPGYGGSGDLSGDATITYNQITHTATVTFTNGGWYVSPEQEWGVQNIHDLAGNLQTINPYSEYSTTMEPPVTTATVTDTSWHNSDITINFICTDTGSGCATTYYSLNNTGYTPGNSVTISDEGENSLYFYSVDKAGNTEQPQYLGPIKIDKTDPVLSIISPTIDSLIAGMFTVDGTAFDSLSGISQLMIDFGNGQMYTLIPTTDNWELTMNDDTNNLADGVYDITVTAEDNAGNSSQSSLTSITIDNTIPTGQAAVLGTFTQGKAPTTSLTLEDNNSLSEVCYTLDSINYICLPISGTSYNWDITEFLNSLGTGNFVLSYYIVDEAGNQSDSNLVTLNYDEYTASGTVQAVQETEEQGEVQGVTTTNLANNTSNTSSSSDDSNTEDQNLSENSDENTEEIKGVADEEATSTEETKSTPLWWPYVLGGIVFLFLVFFLVKRKKDKQKNLY